MRRGTGDNRIKFDRGGGRVNLPVRIIKKIEVNTGGRSQSDLITEPFGVNRSQRNCGYTRRSGNKVNRFILGNKIDPFGAGFPGDVGGTVVKKIHH